MAVEPINYDTLAGQVAARINREISRGTWISVLPSERALTETLQVSRKTVRKSIAQLQRDGVIATHSRLGHRIVLGAPAADKHDLSVGLLAPEALEKLPSYTALWFDELRALLFESGIRLVAFSSCRFFSRGMNESLARLIKQSPQTCWVLTHSNEDVQRWFFTKQIPCIVAGSSLSDVRLPNVDLDHFAICRHAVGAMLRNGHRRFAFLTPLSQRGGDLDSEAGFLDAVKQSTRTDLGSSIARHDGTTNGVWRALSRLFDSKSPPTALLVAKPVFYLTTVSFLADRGLRVGKDVSVICRDHDTFLSYLKPTPAGYSLGPKTYAKRLLPLVLAHVRNQRITQTDVRIEPEFIAGASLGAPREVDPVGPPL